MKPSFLFLTRGDVNQPGVWAEYFKELRADEYSVYAHPKEPERVRSSFLREHIIPEHIETAYADISLVRATLLLLENAFSDPTNDRFILCSESCVPIHNIKVLRDRLSEYSQSFLCALPEIEYFRWKQLTDHSYVKLESFAKHHQWFIFTREIAEHVLSHDDTAVWERVYAADEHYFLNLLIHHRYPTESRVINRATTFVNWDEKVTSYRQVLHEGQPATIITDSSPKSYDSISLQEIYHARRQGCFFLRKVSRECSSTPFLEALRM